MFANDRADKAHKLLESPEFTKSTKDDLQHPATNNYSVQSIFGSCRRAFQQISHRCRSAVPFPNIKAIRPFSAKRASPTPVPTASELACFEHTKSSDIVSISRPSQPTVTVNNSYSAVTSTIKHSAYSPTHTAPTPTAAEDTISSAEISIQRLAKGPQPDPASYISTLPTTSPHTPRENSFIIDAPVSVYRGGPGIKPEDLRYAVILYDSGCEHNLMSTHFMETFRKPQSATNKRIFAMSITGQPFEDEGEVDIRWRDDNISQLKFLNATCRIVNSNLFDVIIGRRTILDKELFVRKPDIAGPLLTSPPSVPVSSVSQTQREADIRREQEIKEQEKYEAIARRDQERSGQQNRENDTTQGNSPQSS